MLKHIFTIYTLSDPREPEVIRFVGMTTQPVYKRVADILSVAKNDYGNGHKSFLSVWVRELIEAGLRPHWVGVANISDKTEADAQFIEIFNQHVQTGLLVNSTIGDVRNKGVCSKQLDGTTKRPGRHVEVSDNARRSLRRKLANDQSLKD